MRGNARRATRLGAYVASGALAVTGAILAVTPAEAVPDPQPANQAADWLADELDSGLMHNNGFGGFDDYGLSIDTGLALAAVGGHASDVNLVSGAIADNIVAYIGNDAPEAYSGAAAKAAVLAQTANDDATAFGGVNLIQRVEARVSSANPIQGRLEDKSDFGDYANTLGQSFAANSLTEAGSAKAAAVTNFLLKQQCSSGYFRLSFSPKTSANQSCVNGSDAPDTDATAIAVLQLSGVTGNADIITALTKAKTWLAAQQRCDGSFGGGTSTEGSNANSTGLVAWALGDSPASRQAGTWLRAHQATAADAGNQLATQTGAIAYDNAGLTDGRANGITDANSDQFRRATAQAAPGIAWFSSDPTPDIALTGPTGFQKTGTRPVFTTQGAAAGTVLCLTGPGASTRGIAGSTGYNSAVTLPAGTATRVYTVRDPFGHADAQALKVLGRANLSVLRGKYKVKRSRTVTATARYLAPGEWTRIYYKGIPVRSGKASATGTFSASFKVGRAKGKKTIAAYGLFTDIRRGTAVIKVVR